MISRVKNKEETKKKTYFEARDASESQASCRRCHANRWWLLEMSTLYLKKVSIKKTNKKGKKSIPHAQETLRTSLGHSPQQSSHSPIIPVVVMLMAIIVKTAHCPTIVMWCRGGGDICHSSLRW